MIDEASGFLGRWLSRADLGNEVFHESVSPLTDTQFDPMCLEAGILPDQPSSVRCNDDAAAIDTTMADLESIRFDVPEMAQGGSPTGVKHLSTTATLPSATRDGCYQAQRETSKKVTTSRHQTRGPGPECDDEKDGHNIGQSPAGCVLVPAVYGYFLLNANQIALRGA